jgi:hypothetical protein
MRRFFTLLSAICQKSGQRSTRRPERRTHLQLETLEGRLVPSTIVPERLVPLSTSALVGSLQTSSSPALMAQPSHPINQIKAVPVETDTGAPRGKLHGVHHVKPLVERADLGLNLSPTQAVVKERPPLEAAPPDLVGVTLYWTPNGTIVGRTVTGSAIETGAGRMGYLTIDSEDLNSGRFSGTVVYYDDHYVPTSAPVVGVISSLTAVAANGGHTYNLSFTNSDGSPVAFTGTISIYPGAIGISGVFSAEGVTGQVRGSEMPIVFHLYSEDSWGQFPAPTSALAHAIDSVFSAQPHLPLMLGRK